MKPDEIKLGDFVYHKDIYDAKEKMKITGILEDKVELEGDYSGGTNNVCQRSWLPYDGLTKFCGGIEPKFFKTKIISAFPGTGKSVYHQKHKESTLDSDSSNFSWIIDKEGNKVRNPDFPRNYISHIKENIGKYEFIFVSSHKEVRDALLAECIFFYLVYPSSERKEEFIERYKNRGNDEKFIELVSNKWDEWMKEIWFLEDGLKKIKMVLPNLEDELRHLKATIYGGDLLS